MRSRRRSARSWSRRSPSSIFGVVLLVLLGVAAYRATLEEVVAFSSIMLGVLFIAYFPFVFALSKMLPGGELAWIAGWVETAGFCAWWSAAGHRADVQHGNQ